MRPYTNSYSAPFLLWLLGSSELNFMLSFYISGTHSLFLNIYDLFFFIVSLSPFFYVLYFVTLKRIFASGDHKYVVKYQNQSKNTTFLPFLAQLRESVTQSSSAIIYKVIAVVTEELNDLFRSHEKPSLHSQSNFDMRNCSKSASSINHRTQIISWNHFLLQNGILESYFELVAKPGTGVRSHGQSSVPSTALAFPWPAQQPLLPGSPVYLQRASTSSLLNRQPCSKPSNSSRPLIG